MLTYVNQPSGHGSGAQLSAMKVNVSEGKENCFSHSYSRAWLRMNCLELRAVKATKPPCRPSIALA